MSPGGGRVAVCALRDAQCLSDTFFWLRDTFGSHIMELGGEAGIGEMGDAEVRSRVWGRELSGRGAC